MGEPMRALILVGGKGARLAPAISDVPKPLAPVGDRPFLSYVLEKLVSAGVEESVLLAGHMADQVAQQYGGGSFGDMRVTCVTEPLPLGTAGALRNSAGLCRGDPVLLLNGDSWVHFDVGALHGAMNRLDAELVLTVLRRPDVSAFGSIEADGNGRLVRFTEKKGRGPGWMNGGVYLVTDRFVDRIPPGQAMSLEREAIPAALAHGAVIGVSECEGPFYDIGTPGGYRSFCDAVKAGVV